MITTVEVQREGNESNSSVLRRFTKRVQSSGVVKRAKSLRYNARPQSHFKKKKSALTRLTRKISYDRLKKLGKI
ncbi:MAG: hypothetical protein AAB364_00670 [Patescibacteria group bacterium]